MPMYGWVDSPDPQRNLQNPTGERDSLIPRTPNPKAILRMEILGGFDWTLDLACECGEPAEAKGLLGRTKSEFKSLANKAHLNQHNVLLLMGNRTQNKKPMSRRK